MTPGHRQEHHHHHHPNLMIRDEKCDHCGSLTMTQSMAFHSHRCDSRLDNFDINSDTRDSYALKGGSRGTTTRSSTKLVSRNWKKISTLNGPKWCRHMLGCLTSKSGFRQLVYAVLILVLVMVPLNDALPVKKGPSSNEITQAVSYLTKYGYLPPESQVDTQNLRMEDQLRDAIKTMQAFGNLKQTGRLDDDTIRLMRKKRCGNLDLPVPPPDEYRTKRYAIHGGKWPKVDLTWSLNPSYMSSSLSVDTVRETISKALKVWSEASKLTFTEIRGEEADIVVSFYSRYHGDGYPFDGPGAVLAHAFFPAEGRGGDTHFDEDEVWLVGNHESDEGVSLLSVAAHEFGHSLGLSHSSVPEALMFPYYQGIKTDFKLPYDDTIGIQQLYGGEPSWAPLPPMATRSPVTPTTATTPTHHDGGHQPTNQPPGLPGETPPTISSVEKPDTCDTSYDAISVIRDEIFIFKDLYFWRLDSNGLRADYPVEIDRFWYNLPANMTHVDALYERPKDKMIVFFIGKHYWVYDANKPLSDYPKPLTHLGLPPDLDKIDAAMVWGHNKKTYFFSGTMYWRFDEDEQLVELDYPRDMSMWRGVPHNIDAAFKWTDGHTYFFKGKGFWKFNDRKMQVASKIPSLSAPFWMGCPDQSVETNAPEEERVDKPKDQALAMEGGTAALSSGILSIGVSCLTALAFIYYDLQWGVYLVTCRISLPFPS